MTSFPGFLIHVMTSAINTERISFLSVWFGVGFSAHHWDPCNTF